jgi:hypothetical protein
MSPTGERMRLEFEIQSLDPTRSTSQAVPEVAALAAELQSALQARFPGAKVRIERAEGLPLIPEIQHILLHIDWDVVRKAIETTAATFATTEFLTLVKTRLKNLSAKKVSAPAGSVVPQASKPPRKTRVKATRQKHEPMKHAKKTGAGKKRKKR